MLDALHSTIVARLNADIPGLATCDDYPKIERRVSIPAVLVELEELEPDDFGEDAAFDCWARFTAYCIYDPNAANAQHEVRNLAATVAVRVSQEEDFGSDDVAQNAEVLRVSEDNFKPELQAYLVWAVEFRLGLSIGENIWSANPADGVSVVTISVGDLDNVDADHSMTAGADEPAALDNTNLPDTPKG